MKDLSKKPVSIEPVGNGKYYPQITVTDKQVPELSDMSVGDEINLMVVAKIKGLRKYGNGDTEFELELTKAECEEEKENETNEESSD